MLLREDVQPGVRLVSGGLLGFAISATFQAPISGFFTWPWTVVAVRARTHNPTDNMASIGRRMEVSFRFDFTGVTGDAFSV